MRASTRVGAETGGHHAGRPNPGPGLAEHRTTQTFGKREDMIVHEHEPFNAETGLVALAESSLTATDAFYVRGHGPVPDIDPAVWRLRVHGLVDRELDLSLATLREALPARTVTATLQCAAVAAPG